MSIEHLVQAAENEEPDEVTLESVAEYGKALVSENDKLKELKAALKEQQARVTKLSQELLPQAMGQIGLSSMELAGGGKITVKEDVSCSVIDIDKLYAFLDERGDAALVKTNIEMGKLPPEILNGIIKLIYDTYNVECTGGLKIHPSTLNAYVRKLCGINGGDCEIPLAALDESIIKAYVYYKTTIGK